MRGRALRQLVYPILFLTGALTTLLVTRLRWAAESTSESLQQRVRVLCLVVTHPAQHWSKARHVHATWARKCSRVLYVTNTEPLPSDGDFIERTCDIIKLAADLQGIGEDLQWIQENYCSGDGIRNRSQIVDGASHNETQTEANAGTLIQYDDKFTNMSIYNDWAQWFDPPFPTINVLDTVMDRNGLWNKTMTGFLHAHQYFLGDYDWFLKTDDDTYVVMENLRNLLQFYDVDRPIYFGCNFRSNNDSGYMSGGGGYVLSREALVRFAKVLGERGRMATSTDAEDVMMGEAMTAAGVEAGDSSDAQGRPRFFPLSAHSLAYPDSDDKPAWYWRLTGYPHTAGPGCCSSTTISFHYTSPSDMYYMEMMLYHIRPHGYYFQP